jgi:Domain of unknown function (DUF5615)
MARLFADENVRLPLVNILRDFGHDVQTAYEAGRANQQIPDQDVLTYATQSGRCVLTNNRRHFHRLHAEHPAHSGIVTYTDDSDVMALAVRIDNRLKSVPDLSGQLLKITRPG